MKCRYIFLYILYSLSHCLNSCGIPNETDESLVNKFYRDNVNEINNIFDELFLYRNIQHIVYADSFAAIYLKNGMNGSFYYFMEHDSFLREIRFIEGPTSIPERLLFGDLINGASIFDGVIRINVIDPRYFIFKCSNCNNCLSILEKALGNFDEKDIIIINCDIVAIKRGNHGKFFNYSSPRFSN